MSRTRHHGDKAKERLLGKRVFIYQGPGWYWETRPKQPRRQCDWHWLSTTPSWWVREFMTVPQRAEVRRLTHRVMKGDLEQTWPLPKKPHVYYW